MANIFDLVTKEELDEQNCINLRGKFKIGQEKTIFYNSSASAADQEQTKITPATLFKNQQPCKFFKNSSKNNFSDNNKNTAILYKWDKRSQIAHFHVKFDDSKIVYNVNYNLFHLANKGLDEMNEICRNLKAGLVLRDLDLADKDIVPLKDGQVIAYWLGSEK